MRLATLKKKFNDAEELTLDGSDGTSFLRTADETAAVRSIAQQSITTDEEGNSKHDLFMKDIRQIFSQVSNNRKEYAEYARLALVELLREGVEIEKSGKSEYEFDPKDPKIDEMINFMMEQITNTSRQLNEKKRQVRYTPMTMQLCYAMWSRSPAGYREMKSLSPLALPCERQLQNLKQANRVKDGRDIKTYQMRAATRGLDRKSEFGYLMTDEMKLKHGVLWNSQTGEACGLADDMLELNVVLKRLLSDEGDVVKPAVYVNQWRYISIRAGKPEGWNCGFFYNDGSLTGGTLLRQFDHVTVCCESIGSKVYGLVLDAGGNNAKFTSRLRDDKKLDDEATWIDEELCYTPNPVDPTRRIYTWFCMTHLLKAMRNQLFASQQNGSKSFIDKHGTSFGWAFIVKLNQVLQDEKMGDDNNLKRNVRLNDKSTNPTSYRKMSVSDAKIPFETKTLSFAEEQICKVLGIEKHVMESEVQKRLEINNNPHIQLGNSAGANKNRRHGYHLEKAKFIYEMILECEKNGDRTPITDAHHRALTSMQVDYSFEDDDDTEMAELDLTEIDLGTNADKPEHATAIIEEIEASKDDTSKKKRPLPTQPKHSQINSEIHSEASTLLFMSHINAIFHDMVLNKNEKLNNDNINEYKHFLQKTMTYFGDMKIEQLNRRANGDKDWERHFLDRVTWRNLRGGLCPFIYFAEYILKELPPEIDGFTFVPMLFSNQSPLESQFSAIRASNHDNATTYAAEITNKNIRQAKTAVNKGGAYTADDCPEEEDVTTVTGVAALTKYMKESTLKLDAWKKKRSDMKNNNNSETNNEQSNIDKLFESNKLEELASKMNTHIDTVGFVDRLVTNTYFQQWFLLSVDSPDRMKWFDELLSVDNEAFDKVCRSILLTLFALMEDAMTSDDDRCYEKLFRDYLVVQSKVGEEPSDLDMLIQADLPSQLRNNRLCAIYLVEILKTMLDDCLYKSVKEMASKSSEPVQIDTTNDLFLASMQQMVGSGIRTAKLEYCPTRSDKDEAWELLDALYFEHDATTPPSQEYMSYYPRQIEFANSGGLHLIQPDLIPWSIDLLKFIMESYLDENITMNRREYIAVSLTKLRNDKVLFAKFKEIIDKQNLGFSNDTLLEKIHLRIAEYAFRAYTKQKNNDKFNKIKALASDKTNLAFRTQVQTGGKDGTEELTSKDTTTATTTTNNQELAQQLGMKNTTAKRKRTSKEVENKRREEYKTHYEKALGKFEKHTTNNPRVAKLTIKECAAVLTIGFDNYINWQAQLKENILNKVQKEIDKKDSSKPFWTSRQQSKKQRVDEPSPNESIAL